MQLLERDGSLTDESFNTFLENKSRGGVLSDAVGLGKTCTAIPLALSDDPHNDPAPTLVVAPSHLLPQWRNEVQKFCGDVDGSNAVLPVIQGTAAFEAWAADGGAGRRAIVLVVGQ
jgi:SNF2 family DNA or RNA helicase